MFEAIFTSQRNEFFGPSVDYNILRTYSIYRHMFKNTFSQCMHGQVIVSIIISLKKWVSCI